MMADIQEISINNNVYDIKTKNDHALKGYLDEGELLTDAEGLADVKYYNRSTFDRSKFTVVGSPTITDDGIASGFSSSNYLTVSQFDVTKPFSVKIPFVFNTGSTNWKDLFAIGYTYIDIGADVNVRMSLQLSTSGQIVSNKFINNFVVGSSYYIIFAWDGSEYTTKIYDTNNILIDTVSYTSSEHIDNGNTRIGYIWNNWPGSIDLKQLSITVDGKEVFNGNKQGIDQIKKDDYILAGGDATVSNDGILTSASNANNYWTRANITSAIDTSLDIYYKFRVTSTPSGTIMPIYCDNSFQIQVSTSLRCSIFIRTGTSATYWDVFANSMLGTLSIGEWYTLHINWNGTQYTVIFKNNNGEIIETLTANNTNAIVAYTYFRLLYSGASITQSMQADLNALKVYENGSLIYQPTLRIPYNQSKTGSKIVDSYYRDRVQDMYEQFGNAPYYTLSDIDFTIPMGEVYGMKADKGELDGEWHIESLTIANQVAWSGNGQIATYSLANYLPNDGNVYEVIIQGTAAPTASTANKFVYLGIQTDLMTCALCGSRVNVANIDSSSYGTSTILVGAERNIIKTSSTSNNAGGTYTLIARGYRKVRSYDS